MTQIFYLHPMVRLLLFFTLFLFSPKLHAQDFEWKKPNHEKLALLVDVWEYKYTLTYLYLKENYRVLSEMDSVEYWQGDTDEICAFQQNFDPGIRYSVKQCFEGGSFETLHFPKMRTETLRAWVEQMYETELNSWTSLFDYEPEDAGCYYHISQTDQYTVLEIYCGC